jgi:hypothetical protein
MGRKWGWKVKSIYIVTDATVHAEAYMSLFVTKCESLISSQSVKWLHHGEKLS